MNIELTFLSIIEILTFSAAFMLGLLFFTMKSANKKANIFLGLFLWLLAISILLRLIDYEIDEDSIVNRILFLMFLCIPFLLYMYTYQTINKPYIKTLTFIFLPIVLIDLTLIFAVNKEIGFLILDLIHFPVEIVLYVLILRKTKRIVSELNSFYSDLENKRLTWIKAIVYISLAFILFDIIEVVLDLDEETIEPFFHISSVVLAFIMVYWIAYNGFSQSEVFKASLFSDDLKNESLEISNTDLTVEENDIEKERFNIIKDSIAKEKLFTNANLNLRTLSESLQLKEKELSKLINTYSGTSFYHFINGFRIQEFKRLMKTPKAKQLSILGLAEEAGFSSKSTFYSVFKTIEGMTPKQYELSIKKSE
ncbi:helix-turn-helix domain-containing protein [Aquimarina sp. 2201CG14-23]|uniref:helix-turn-helix domain-containing protein n=1 Tax=Aquimarina mycalae TaxID=3040073 RepID=UPI0024780393|nr:helix-turn-helix domain-containing protein [Aquimarina sp. 2201CG14-23]MDH7447907.1 helix-turn-helix domain-containing protein [Aquimarina sp. 2201CG14-23]